MSIIIREVEFPFIFDRHLKSELKDFFVLEGICELLPKVHLYVSEINLFVNFWVVFWQNKQVMPTYF